MNSTTRTGLNIKVAFESSLKNKIPLTSCHENIPVNMTIVTDPGIVHAHSESDQASHQFWFKRLLRAVAQYIYRLSKPAARPIAFRVRRFLIDGLRQEIQQEIQRASAATTQEIQQQIQLASVATTHVIQQEFQRASVSTTQVIQQEIQRTSVDATQVIQQEIQRTSVAATQVIQQEIQRASVSTTQVIQQEIQRASAARVRQFLSKSSADLTAELPISPVYDPTQIAWSYLDAGTLYSLYKQWSYHSEILRQASLVVACPLTADAARDLLQPSELVIVASPQDWQLLLSGRRWEVIALVGLDLMHQVLQSKQLPYQLVRACRSEILYFVKSDDDVFHQRRPLHQVGFCEVASVLSDGRLDNFTTGWSTKGDFLLGGSLPVLSWPGGEWCLHRASRVSQMEAYGAFRWKSILGNGLQVSDMGWTGTSNDLLLSVCEGVSSKNSVNNYEQRVRAVMQWPWHSGEGHAALVGGYQGPGDTHMALAMIQVDRSGAVALSLWLHDNQWSCLKTTQLSAEDCQLNNGYFQVQCWLHLSSNHIRAGCGDQVLLEVPVTHKLRATTAGLRIHSNHIAVKNFDFQMGDGHG